MFNIVNLNRNDCFNFEFGNWFKKINVYYLYISIGIFMYIILWVKKRKYDFGKKVQIDRQIVKYYLK